MFKFRNLAESPDLYSFAVPEKSTELIFSVTSPARPNGEDDMFLTGSFLG